jgi:serine/threonine protein kinase
MQEKRVFLGKQVFGDWTILKKLSGGGNGDVWLCKNDNDERCAIKLLKKSRKIAFQRFTDEVNTILSNQDIKGVVEIIDYSLPEDYVNEVPYYVMPIGEPITTIINSTFNEKIDFIISIGTTLYHLHQRGIAHRDIKLSNFILLNNEPLLIDFGLVDFPDKIDITQEKEQIGPRFTIAPEITRQETNKNIDYLKTDIYSLGKTLWILLTNVKFGFEGQYNTDTILELKKHNPDVYTSPIDKLLVKCTDNDPENRPSIEGFLGALHEWKKLNEDFHLRNNNQWAELLNKLFPISTPNRVIWTDIDEIIKILNMLGETPSLNHLFFPKSGGLDLEGAKKSIEEDCIELDMQLIYIIKPIRLLFESFGDDVAWNYFRIETGGLSPSGVYDEEQLEGRVSETVSELYPGHYEDYGYAEHPDYYREMGEDIPKTVRHVTRYFEGSFVIFNKRSHYNLDNKTYDGRHNRMSTDEFREYINNSIQESQPKNDFDSILDKILGRR